MTTSKERARLSVQARTILRHTCALRSIERTFCAQLARSHGA
jgi:hypothetical protein